MKFTRTNTTGSVGAPRKTAEPWRALYSEARESAACLCTSTDEHIFNEPLFDLVAVCGTCHQGLHAPPVEGGS